MTLPVVSRSSTAGHQRSALWEQHGGVYFLDPAFISRVFEQEATAASAIEADIANTFTHDNINLHAARKRRRGAALDDFGSKPGKVQVVSPKTQALSKATTEVLKTWFFEHFDNPYPQPSEKEMLCKAAGITKIQLRNWFTNMRKRHWKPIKAGHEPKCYIDFILYKKFQSTIG